MVTEAQRAAARGRKRLQRQREREQVIRSTALAPDDDPADAASDQVLPSGVTQPEDDTENTMDLMREQAIWVRRRRQITEIELRRREGEVILREEAERQAATLGRRVRAALERAPSLLPGDISPENRSACATAMSSAIRQALALIP